MVWRQCMPALMGTIYATGQGREKTCQRVEILHQVELGLRARSCGGPCKGNLTSNCAWDNRTRAIRKSGGPRRVVQDRRASQTCRLERVAGCGIIGARRTSSAHLHRPWRTTTAVLTIRKPRDADLRATHAVMVVVTLSKHFAHPSTAPMRRPRQLPAIKNQPV
jgi:hypothetical protein